MGGLKKRNNPFRSINWKYLSGCEKTSRTVMNFGTDKCSSQVPAPSCVFAVVRNWHIKVAAGCLGTGRSPDRSVSGTGGAPSHSAHPAHKENSKPQNTGAFSELLYYHQPFSWRRRYKGLQNSNIRTVIYVFNDY